jgi:hypothetical protein
MALPAGPAGAAVVTVEGDRGARAGAGKPRWFEPGSAAVARGDPADVPYVAGPGRGIAKWPAERIGVSRPMA